MAENSKKTGTSDFRQNRHDTLMRFHMPAQRAISLVAGPVMVLVSFVLLLTDFRWQFAVNMVSAVVLQTLFVFAYLLARKGDLKKSAIISTLAVAAYGLVAILMIEGLLHILLMACVASAIRVSLVSRRFTLVFVLALGVAYGGIGLVQHFDLYEALELAPLKLLIIQSSLVFFMLLMALRYLMQIHQINELLFRSMDSANQKHVTIIDAVQRIHPVMARAASQIEEISSGFASQASEQAAATSEVNATVGEVEKISERAVIAATEAELVSDSARTGLVENSRRLKDLVRGFENAVEGIEISRSDITNLSEEVGRIEVIMEMSREVGEQIKVLAVNASIEASSAGEHGKGFSAVASELRNLIRGTDDNLVNSNEILRVIRERSSKSAESIRLGAEELLSYYGDLRTMGELIEESAASLLEAARNVNEIAVSAREQQAGMREISATMTQLDAAASQLNVSASALSGVVVQLSGSGSDLDNVLTGSFKPGV